MRRRSLLKPAFVASGEGEARWWGGGLAVLKATTADTGGQMTIVEVTEPPGTEAPLHVHYKEDEAFRVLDGDVTLQIGETTIEAYAVDYAFGPRHVPHRYTVGAAGWGAGCCSSSPPAVSRTWCWR